MAGAMTMQGMYETQLANTNRMWQERLEQVNADAHQRTQAMGQEIERLQSRCSDLQMQHAMAQVQIAEELKRFLMQHHSNGYASVPLILQWMLQKTNGIVGPEDAPLSHPGGPAAPPAPAPAPPATRKRGRADGGGEDYAVRSEEGRRKRGLSPDGMDTSVEAGAAAPAGFGEAPCGAGNQWPHMKRRPPPRC